MCLLVSTATKKSQGSLLDCRSGLCVCACAHLLWPRPRAVPGPSKGADATAGLPVPAMPKSASVEGISVVLLGGVCVCCSIFLLHCRPEIPVWDLLGLDGLVFAKNGMCRQCTDKDVGKVRGALLFPSAIKKTWNLSVGSSCGEEQEHPLSPTLSRSKTFV